jgi:hypothetical protein
VAPVKETSSSARDAAAQQLTGKKPMTFGVTTDDDTWHEPSSDDPCWTETLWLRFAVPDRHLTGILYAIFRPNQRVASLFVYLWDRAAATEETALYVHRAFHLPLPEDLRDVRLPGGFSYRCIDPLTTYEVHYDDGVELRVDLRYTGVQAPVGRGPDGTTTSYFQPSHVTGSLWLNGDEVQVDCYELRGSAWGVRPDLRSPPRPDDLTKAVGHADTYAASADTTFFMGSAGDLVTTSFHSGFLMRDGEIQRRRSAHRPAERRRPPRIDRGRSTGRDRAYVPCSWNVRQPAVHPDAELRHVVQRRAVGRRR